MKHVASRLVRYANDNKVIHIDNVTDVALNRLARDKKINHKIRAALKELDNQLELVIPRQVDDREQQFKRFLQSEFGLVINLSSLAKNHSGRYRKLQLYGTPSDVLTRWGLDYEYDRNLEVRDFKKLLANHSDWKRVIRRLHTIDPKLYAAITYQAKKEGLSAKEYTDNLGFTLE